MDEKQRRRHTQTRKHHYVPAFLLQGFTDSGQRDDSLWVHDFERRKTWRAKPDQVANSRDYYKVDILELDPNIVETAFSKAEARVAPVIREMIRRHELPSGENFQAIIEFAALLALRTPSFRNMYERNMEQLYRWYAKVALSQRDIFDQLVEEERKAGREIPPEITYERLHDFALDDSKYTVHVPRTMSVRMLLKLWEDLVPVFMKRNWSLANMNSEEGCLICSDMPSRSP